MEECGEPVALLGPCLFQSCFQFVEHRNKLHFSAEWRRPKSHRSMPSSRADNLGRGAVRMNRHLACVIYFGSLTSETSHSFIR